MWAQGFEDSFSFSTTLNDQDIYSAIGKGMNIHGLLALGRKIDSYMWGSTAPLAPLICSYTSSEKVEMIHCSLGHPSDDATRKMGYPTLKGPCAICDAHKSRHAKSSTVPVPKATAFLERVHVDMKISSKLDQHGRTRVLEFVDSCTNDSWTKNLPDGTTAPVIKTMREWMVSDLQNQLVQLVVLDNDPAFTSEEMVAFMEKEVKIPHWYSCAYHQHQNGVAETLWARLALLVFIFITAAPWLGHDFWTEAMIYANESIRR